MTLHKIFAISGLALTTLAAPNMSLASIGAGFDLNPLILDTAPTATIDDGSYEEARRGRGRGRGGDRDRSNDDDRGGRDDRSERDNSRDDGTSGRSRPRIPGGSGCDDPQDILEHPECRDGAAPAAGSGNGGGVKNGNGHGGRPRIPGGSGCDDPQDLIEHPECRV